MRQNEWCVFNILFLFLIMLSIIYTIFTLIFRSWFEKWGKLWLVIQTCWQNECCRYTMKIIYNYLSFKGQYSGHFCRTPWSLWTDTCKSLKLPTKIHCKLIVPVLGNYLGNFQYFTIKTSKKCSGMIKRLIFISNSWNLHTANQDKSWLIEKWNATTIISNNYFFS